MLKIGDKFKLTADAIENYGEEFKNRWFTVEYIDTFTNEGAPLYDAKELNFSVYDWEIEESKRS
jgi:hypothetical protein